MIQKQVLMKIEIIRNGLSLAFRSRWSNRRRESFSDMDENCFFARLLESTMLRREDVASIRRRWTTGRESWFNLWLFTRLHSTQLIDKKFFNRKKIIWINSKTKVSVSRHKKSILSTERFHNAYELREIRFLFVINDLNHDVCWTQGSIVDCRKTILRKTNDFSIDDVWNDCTIQDKIFQTQTCRVSKRSRWKDQCTNSFRKECH